jgi:hypothetical protein
MSRVLGNVNEKEDSAYDSASASEKSSIKEISKNSDNYEQSENNYQYDGGYDDPNMKSLSYNTENIDSKVSDMANFYKYSKLQSTVRNIPVHKFLSIIEAEEQEVKELLRDGKKQRRILKAKLSKTENDVSITCDNLVSKGFKDIEAFRQDMLKLIQKNIKEAISIGKEVAQCDFEMQQAKKDTLVLNSIIKDAEHDLGLLSYTKEIE